MCTTYDRIKMKCLVVRVPTTAYAQGMLTLGVVQLTILRSLKLILGSLGHVACS